MKPNEPDIKVACAIKAIRLLRGTKQINIANALTMSEGFYCKIENGKHVLSLGQLYSIADYFKVNCKVILGVAEIISSDTNDIEPLSKIKIEFLLTLF